MDMLVMSIMTEKSIPNQILEGIKKLIEITYTNISIRVECYKYENDLYINTDIDIIDIQFISSFNEEKIKLAKLLVEIYKEINTFGDILVGYQDTTSYVETYQKNRHEGLIIAGIVGTQENLQRDDLFYTQDEINIYFNNQIEVFGKYYEDIK